MKKRQVQSFLKITGAKLNFLAAGIYSHFLKPFSRYFRKVFEFAKIKQTMGAFMVASVFATAVLPPSIEELQTSIDKNQTQIVLAASDFSTESSIRLPLDNFIISQGYSFFHPGVDFAAPLGSPVYAIMAGKVETVERDRWGYGNHLYIDHGNGTKSLYAHLSQIMVKEGDVVTKETKIGLVGSTGKSTGPHLHLQVWEENRLTNPVTFFEGYFGRKLVSIR